MELVINISEEDYRKINKIRFLLGGKEDRSLQQHIIEAIKKSIKLPKEHGSLIDGDALEKAMLDREEILGDDQACWESSAVSVALDTYGKELVPSTSYSKLKERLWPEE